MAFIEVRDVTKTYKMGEVEIKAVDEIGFGIDKGDRICCNSRSERSRKNDDT